MTTRRYRLTEWRNSWEGRECCKGARCSSLTHRRRVNSAALRNYMSYFDMKGQTLVEAFR